MPRLIVIAKDGTETAIDAAAGVSVMEVVRDSGSDELLALCGGNCSCATCHVYVEDPSDAARLAPASEMELELLDALTHRRDTSRLSCQIRFDETLDGLKVTIAPEE